MKKRLVEMDKLGYPWWVDGLPLFFWLDEELREWLLKLGVI